MKAKCSGCKALVRTKDEQQRDAYGCLLNFKQSYAMINNMAIAPKPEEPCYKPKTTHLLKEAENKKAAS